MKLQICWERQGYYNVNVLPSSVQSQLSWTELALISSYTATRPLALVPPANPPHEHHRALIASIWHPLEEDNIDILSVPAVCDSIVKAGAVEVGGGGAGGGGVQVGQEPRTEAWEYRFVSGGGFTWILAYLYCPHHSYEQPLR